MERAVARRPEILAPAGDRERLEAALRYGADAVYFSGRRYGMRAGAGNFDADGIREAVRLAHQAGARAYVACNTLPRVDETAALPAYLELLDDAGTDALIVADLGVMALAKRYAPRCALHVSTQLGVTNQETARVLYEMGAARVVLARELSLDEVAALRERAPAELELECFVHGAMCLSVSGRCVLSNYLAGRDANRGECAQPCRWKYHLMESKRPGEYYEIGEQDGGAYILNANDLCMLPHVAALAQAGVASFKIEGRAKAAYYTAVITNAYRTAAEGYAASGFRPDYRPSPWILAEADKVSHRPYGTGFYFGAPSQDTAQGGYVQTWEAAAVVEGFRDGMLTVTQRNRFERGETLEALEPGGRPPFSLLVNALYDEQGEPLAAAPHPMQRLRIPAARPLAPGSILRRRKTAGAAADCLPYRIDG